MGKVCFRGAHPAQYLGKSNVFRVAIPSHGILPNVFSDSAKLAFMPHDVFPIVPLPHGPTSQPKRPIHLNRRKRLERPYDLAQRQWSSGRGAACCAPSRQGVNNCNNAVEVIRHNHKIKKRGASKSLIEIEPNISNRNARRFQNDKPLKTRPNILLCPWAQIVTKYNPACE